LNRLLSKDGLRRAEGRGYKAKYFCTRYLYVMSDDLTCLRNQLDKKGWLGVLKKDSYHALVFV